MKKVKNILFKMEIEGNGVVNYDGKDQKFLWNDNTKDTGQEYVKYDNVTFAKKRWYKKDDKFEKRLIISSNCLRHHIFIDDIMFQSPNLMHNLSLLTSMIASPASLLRGYLFGEKGGLNIKRSTALNITDAEQTNEAISAIEKFTRSGTKTSDETQKDITFFGKEVIGDITYETIGNIDLMQMQFISADQIFDRLAMDPDLFIKYSQILKNRMPSFNSNLEYYQINNSIVELPEYGILLNNDDIIFLTKELLKRMLKLSIKKASSYAETSKLKIKFVYDTIDDRLNSKDGWIEVTEDFINELSFESEIFYTLKDNEDAKLLRKNIEEIIKIKQDKRKIEQAEIKEKNKKIKDEKKKNEAELKNKKSSEIYESEYK